MNNFPDEEGIDWICGTPFMDKLRRKAMEKVALTKKQEEWKLQEKPKENSEK